MKGAKQHSSSVIFPDHFATTWKIGNLTLSLFWHQNHQADLCHGWKADCAYVVRVLVFKLSVIQSHTACCLLVALTGESTSLQAGELTCSARFILYRILAECHLKCCIDMTSKILLDVAPWEKHWCERYGFVCAGAFLSLITFRHCESYKEYVLFVVGCNRGFVGIDVNSHSSSSSTLLQAAGVHAAQHLVKAYCRSRENCRMYRLNLIAVGMMTMGGSFHFEGIELSTCMIGWQSRRRPRIQNPLRFATLRPVLCLYLWWKAPGSTYQDGVCGKQWESG